MMSLYCLLWMPFIIRPAIFPIAPVGFAPIDCCDTLSPPSFLRTLTGLDSPSHFQEGKQHESPKDVVPANCHYSNLFTEKWIFQLSLMLFSQLKRYLEHSILVGPTFLFCIFNDDVEISTSRALPLPLHHQKYRSRPTQFGLYVIWVSRLFPPGRKSLGNEAVLDQRSHGSFIACSLSKGSLR